MTLEELKQYRYIRAEIDALENQIDTIITKVPTTGTARDGTQSFTVSNPTENKAMKIDDIRKRIDGMLERCNGVIQWLDECEDVELVAICRNHYILGYSWSKTAWLVYGCGNEATPRKRVSRYFEK